MGGGVVFLLQTIDFHFSPIVVRGGAVLDDSVMMLALAVIYMHSSTMVIVHFWRICTKFSLFCAHGGATLIYGAMIGKSPPQEVEKGDIDVIIAPPQFDPFRQTQFCQCIEIGGGRIPMHTQDLFDESDFCVGMLEKVFQQFLAIESRFLAHTGFIFIHNVPDRLDQSSGLVGGIFDSF